MIPKIIHYCWLSKDPIPTNLVECMNTWKQALPDYEWIKWDFERFDKSTSIWVAEAFDNKKYAFAADYIRLYALYKYGGFYLDMDVIAKKSLNPFLNLSTCIGWQYDKGTGLEVAAFGVEKKSKWVKDCLDYYSGRRFINPDGTFNTRVLPLIIEEILREKGYHLINVNSIEEALKLTSPLIPVFPSAFFSPKSWETGTIIDNEDTVLIHNFSGSWISKSDHFWNNHPQLLRIKKGLYLIVHHPSFLLVKIRQYFSNKKSNRQ